MNIQTTADLISYVKRRQNKKNEKSKGGKKVSKKLLAGVAPNRLARREGVNYSQLRHLNMYQQTGKNVEIQTDDLDILDLRCSEVNLTEVYHFDKVSSCLRKIVIERGVDAEILRQFEYVHKDIIKSKYRGRQSIMGRYGKGLNKQDQFKKNISDVVGKGEVNRYNDALKTLINKVKDYEHENAYLEEKRSCISSEFPLFKESEDDVFNRGWRKGYAAGYTRGNSNGFFKGSIEAQYIGHQKGIEEGMQEGWNFGFDEGFKTGIRKVFRDARDAGIDLSSLELMEYISREDKIKGLMKNLYTKLTKVFAISDRLEASIRLHEKFSSYSDKRKKLAVKVGKKNIVKMITTFFTSKINSNSNNQMLVEFLYDECIKKYGNSKLADKKLIQIFAGSVYHQKNERVSMFCRALHLSNKRNYSNDILNLYLYILSKFQKEGYNTRINAIKDEVTDGENDFAPFYKAVELFKEIFEEKIPMYSKLKSQVDKMLITKSTIKMIDVDKFLNFVITNYMKYYINFNSPAEIIYNALTLYERNSMTMNELYVITELIKPVSILVDIPEDGKQTTISKEQFYNLFTEHLKGINDERIFSHQYKEVLDNVDVFAARRVKKLFELVTYNKSVNDFKNEFFEIASILKDKLDEIFKGRRWKNINRLEEKNYWLSRIHSISRAIGIVNTTLLKISLTLLKESIDFFLKQKRELLAGREDESEDDEDEDEVESSNPRIHKGSNKNISRNGSRIYNEGSMEREISGDQKSSFGNKPRKMNTIRRRPKLSTKRLRATADEAGTPRSKVSSELSKAGKARKSLSTQKANLVSGFKSKKNATFLNK